MYSQVKRRYITENALYLVGQLTHDKETIEVLYGEIQNRNSRQTLFHGFTGQDKTVEIQTVDDIEVRISDTFEHDGKKYTVVSCAEEPIDKNQLRKLPWKSVDKVWKISLQSVG